ncbi:hypothetical protein D3C74_372660 [compost metagenome]
MKLHHPLQERKNIGDMQTGEFRNIHHLLLRGSIEICPFDIGKGPGDFSAVHRPDRCRMDKMNPINFRDFFTRTMPGMPAARFEYQHGAFLDFVGYPFFRHIQGAL